MGGAAVSSATITVTVSESRAKKILLAGLAGISPGRFTIAIIIGRGIRYFGEGLLALYYGERAVGFIKENSGTVGLWLVGLILVGAGVWWLWQRRRATATPSA